MSKNQNDNRKPPSPTQIYLKQNKEHLDAQKEKKVQTQSKPNYSSIGDFTQKIDPPNFCQIALISWPGP